VTIGIKLFEGDHGRILEPENLDAEDYYLKWDRVQRAWIPAEGGGGGGSNIETGPNLTDSNQTLVTSERYVMLVGTATQARTITLTPSATPARAFQIEIGTQDFNIAVANGGPAGTAGLFSYTVPAGQRQAVFFVSDGTNVSVTAAVPLAEEPTP
jgi:hypothetical protein